MSRYAIAGLVILTISIVSPCEAQDAQTRAIYEAQLDTAGVLMRASQVCHDKSMETVGFKLIALVGNHVGFGYSDYKTSDIGLGIEASAKAVCEKLELVLQFLDKLDRAMPEQKEIEAAA